MPILFTVFQTSYGWCGVIKGDAGILRVLLPQSRKDRVAQTIKSWYPEAVSDKSALAGEQTELRRYFAGQNPDFSFVLDFSGTTLFQRQVWSEVSRIPYGEVRTYSWVAGRIGQPRAVRAVGSALGKNPFPPVIPCHRVIQLCGGLGGYSAAAGVELKAKLLQMEGVTGY